MHSILLEFGALLRKIVAMDRLLFLPALSLALLVSSCTTCHDVEFCDDMLGHSSNEIVAWLGTPTGFKCEYGVDEYTWCAHKEAREHSLRVQPVVEIEFVDAEGLKHVHYRCIVPPADKHDETKDPHLTFRFYNDKACGYYFKNADRICNRFVPDHFLETYQAQQQPKR